MNPITATRLFALLLLLLGFAAAQQQDPELQEKKPVELEVRALANEGFLLSVEDDVVAIDAFLAERYVGYAALEGELLEQLVSGTGPFESIDVALASHYHRDHFQGEPAQRFLAARPECLFASSPQVIDALWNVETEALEGVPEDKIRDFLPKPKKEDLLEVGKVDNQDVGGIIDDACGVQRLPNGNTVIASYHTSEGVKLFEVDRRKRVVWSYSGPHRVHHFQLLTTNGEPIPGPPLK